MGGAIEKMIFFGAPLISIALVRVKWVRFPIGNLDKSEETSVFIGECLFSKMGSFGNIYVFYAVNQDGRK